MDGNQSEYDFESKSSSEEEVMADLMVGNKRLQLTMQEEHEFVTKLGDQGLNDLIRL